VAPRPSHAATCFAGGTHAETKASRGDDANLAYAAKTALGKLK